MCQYASPDNNVNCSDYYSYSIVGLANMLQQALHILDRHRLQPKVRGDNVRRVVPADSTNLSKCYLCCFDQYGVQLSIEVIVSKNEHKVSKLAST